MRKTARCCHQASNRTRRRAPYPLRPCPSRVFGMCGGWLLAENEIHAHAADFDQVAVVEAYGSRNRGAVDRGHFVTGAEIIAVVALVDLCGHVRLEPALQAHGGH